MENYDTDNHTKLNALVETEEKTEFKKEISIKINPGVVHNYNKASCKMEREIKILPAYLGDSLDGSANDHLQINTMSSLHSFIETNSNGNKIYIHQQKKNTINKMNSIFDMRSTVVSKQPVQTGEKIHHAKKYFTSSAKKSTIGSAGKSYRCDICSKGFTNKKRLCLHHQDKRSQIRLKSDLCSNILFKKSDLVSHQRVHTEEKKFKCDFCSKCFKQKSTLVSHQRVHTKGKTFKCDFCSKCYKHKMNLVSHQRVHTGEKPFQCNLCLAIFSKKAHLFSHQRVHTKEKTFKVHTKEKTFKCDLCSKGIKHKMNLFSHQRIHTGKKPFKCNLCLANFSKKSHLDSHQRGNI